MEKILKNKKNYVIKSLNDKKEEHDFYFLRWLAEINKNEKDTNYVCMSIAKYFYEKGEILPFLDVFVVDNNVYIYTKYPGKWIGEKGKDIDELKHFVNYNTNGEMIHNFTFSIINSDKSNFNSILKFLNGYKKQNK